MDARELVLGYLRTLQEQGVQRLPVDEGGRAILREWMLAARRGVRAVAPAAFRAAMTAPAPVEAAEGAPPALQTAAPVPETGDNDSLLAAARELRAAAEAPVEAVSEMPAEEEMPFFRPASDGTPEGAWAGLEKLLPHWKPLRELGTLREKAVFGTGDRRAPILMVGDCPNYHDEKSGRPFSGEAGGKLDGMLTAMGLTREQVYLTHCVKFRPAQPRQTLNTRPPSEKEVRFSLPVLDYEIRLVQPRVIVALGIIPARGLLQQGELPLSAYQSMQGANYNGIPVVVTHHPGYLLRTSDRAERRRLWEEMLRVMEMVGLPISDKQRGYFLPKQK